MTIVLATSIDIAATPEDVWVVLSDFSAYGQWSNFSRVDGRAEPGTRLRMRMPGFRFTSTVTAVTPGRELQWSATILTPRLFLGEHTFTLVEQGGGTRMNNTETFSGALTRPFTRFFAKGGTEGGTAAFNQALKARVEGRTTAA